MPCPTPQTPATSSPYPIPAAFIFDLDGLVLDTESTYCRAWQQAAGRMGYALSDPFCHSLSGLPHQEVEKRLFTVCGADFDLPKFNRLAGKCWRDYVHAHGIPIKPGVVELLAYLNAQHIPFALATNSRAANVQECLALAGLAGAFAVRATRDDVFHGKPAPDVFLHAAALLQTPIRQCWVLEDSLTGILAAHRSGAFAVLIPSLYPVAAKALASSAMVLPDLQILLATIRAEFAHLQSNQV